MSRKSFEDDAKLCDESNLNRILTRVRMHAESNWIAGKCQADICVYRFTVHITDMRDRVHERNDLPYK